MRNKNPKYNLIQNIGLGIAILAVYFWWLFDSNAFTEAREGYLMLTKEKITVSGQFVDTEKFDMDEGGGEIADGYGYKYSFLTQDGRTIEDTGWNYGELPNNIEIEYISDNPNISRIKGLRKNDNNFTDWVQHQLLWKLLGLSICIFFSYRIIKGGIGEWKQ